jgi:hypothetical protein
MLYKHAVALRKRRRDEGMGMEDGVSITVMLPV